MLLICIFHLTSIENGAQCIFSCWHGRCFAGNTWHWPMPKEQIENWVSNVRKRIAISLKRIYHFARKSRDFWFGSITICRSWIHIQFKAIIKRILSQNAAYIWLISSCACFISTQCNAMPIDIWQAFQNICKFSDFSVNAKELIDLLLIVLGVHCVIRLFFLYCRYESSQSRHINCQWVEHETYSRALSPLRK